MGRISCGGLGIDKYESETHGEQKKGHTMLLEAEVVRSSTNPDEWIVEAQTDDGGIRRAIFIDADARQRAEDYAEIIRSQYQLHQRRSVVESAQLQYANPMK